MARLGERVCGSYVKRGGGLGVFDKRVKKGRSPLGFSRVWRSLFFFFKFQFGTFKRLFSNWKKKGGRRDDDVVETTTL